jgi:hypothetical protein
MKKLTIILIAVLLVGCSPCERLQRKCPPVIKDSISYIETMAEDPNYTIPDSVYWQLEFECDSNYEVLLRDFEEFNTGLETIVEIKEVVRWKEDKSKVSRLIVNIGVFTDSIASLNKTIEKLKNTTITVEKEVLVNHIPKIAWFAIIFSACVLIYVGVKVYLRVKLKGFRSLIPKI